MRQGAGRRPISTSEFGADVKNLRVGWERPEKLHLTLKFLGDVTNEQLERLNKAPSNKLPPKPVLFTCVPAKPAFSRPYAKRAFYGWGWKMPAGNYSDLHRILETECEKTGFARETRDFKPHLTIARLREPGKSAGLAAAHLRAQIEPVEFEVPEIVIYESRLAPTGSVYTPVFKYKLTG